MYERQLVPSLKYFAHAYWIRCKMPSLTTNYIAVKWVVWFGLVRVNASCTTAWPRGILFRMQAQKFQFTMAVNSIDGLAKSRKIQWQHIFEWDMNSECINFASIFLIWKKKNRRFWINWTSVWCSVNTKLCDNRRWETVKPFLRILRIDVYVPALTTSF